MTVVLAVLKGILWLLLVLLLLLLAALLIPVTAELCYEKSQFTAALRVLGIRFSVYPFKEETEKKQEKEGLLKSLHRKKQPLKAEKGKEPGRNQTKVESNNKKAVSGESFAAKNAQKHQQTKPNAAENESKKSIGTEPEKTVKKKFDFVQGTHQLKVLVCTAGSVMRKVLAGLKIHHIRVVLPISRGDAAATAIAVGHTHAMLHASLGVLNNFLNLQFKQLDIYPDYLQENKGEEQFSCKITTHLLIMVIIAVWALIRLKKEKVI